MLKLCRFALLTTCLVASVPTLSAEDEAATDAAAAPDTTVPSLKYDLKYKFAAGEVVRTEVVHRATVQTTIQGTSQTADTQSKSVKVWEISDVTPEGNFTFLHKVESIDMWQRMQGRKEVHYNSQTDTEVPPGYEEAAEAVGVPLTIVTMDNRGTILKRQEKRAQPMSMSTQMTMPLPAHPVAIDDKWSSPMDVDVILKDGSTKKVQTRQQFTLQKVVDGIATILVDTQILTPIHDPAIEAQLIQRTSDGHVRFDVEAGRVLGQQLDLDRRVIGFSGPASSMHYLTRFTEELLKDAPQTARRTEPVEDKPAETASDEAPPAETKPAETKPVEVKPAETKSASKKPAPSKPAVKSAAKKSKPASR